MAPINLEPQMTADHSVPYRLEQSTIQGIAEKLAREKGGLPREHWTEALGILDAVYESDILPPLEDDPET